MNNEKDINLDEPNINNQDDSNEYSSLNPKELLLTNDGKNRKDKYIYCILGIIFFALGYLSCYLLNLKDQSKIEQPVSEQLQPHIEQPKTDQPKKEQSTSEELIIKQDLQNNKTIDLKPSNETIYEKLLKEIQKEFDEKNKVNINEIEYKLNISKTQLDDKVKNIVHIAFTLDPGFTLETMLTISSILVSQKQTTKIVFHLGVIDNFKSDLMLKMYELKNKLNNLTEFNFYYLKEAKIKMQNFHPKGAACPGKFELPQLISDDVEKVLLFDAGDLLVLRDLTELFNYEMGDKWVLGPVEPSGIDLLKKNRYKVNAYINIGSILLNIKELKENNFWNTYTKNRHLKCPGAPDQALFNILVPDNKKGYFPYRFGSFVNFDNDECSDKFLFHDLYFDKFFNNDFGKDYPENPKNQIKMIAQMYNPVFVHQFFGKWDQGSGLMIYRHLAKYFMILGGIKDELCAKKPGYCI